MIGGKIVVLTTLAVISRAYDALDPLKYPDAASLASDFLGWICGLRR